MTSVAVDVSFTVLSFLHFSSSAYEVKPLFRHVSASIQVLLYLTDNSQHFTSTAGCSFRSSHYGWVTTGL
jgi:hypothetical protein